MSKVFFFPISSYQSTAEINEGSKKILEHLINEEKIELPSYVPLKVHFGEKKNQTFIKSENYLGVIEYLHAKDIDSAYIESNALYNGERQNRTSPIQLAQRHGFTQLPIVIADGEYGDEFEIVKINGTHFDSCFIAKAIADLNHMIVLSHFKGHLLAGFGGAIKQLAMGCGSRGGKLAQHSNAIPKIKAKKCESCGDCLETCPAGAIILEPSPMIDEDKCIGCASCMSVCKQNAVTITWWASVSKKFREKIAEYALAAQKDKEIIYLNFVLNITRGCDCEAHKMKPIVPDVGILASVDPVGIDAASLDLTQKMKGRKIFNRGRRALDHAEKLNLGTSHYELVDLKVA